MKQFWIGAGLLLTMLGITIATGMRISRAQAPVVRVPATVTVPISLPGSDAVRITVLPDNTRIWARASRVKTSVSAQSGEELIEIDTTVTTPPVK